MSHGKTSPLAHIKFWLPAKCQLFSINTPVPVELFNRHVQMKPSDHIGVLIFSELIFSNPVFDNQIFIHYTCNSLLEKHKKKNLSINIHITLKCVNKKQNVISHKKCIPIILKTGMAKRHRCRDTHKSILTAGIARVCILYFFCL